jgi:hypothetical protein
MHTPARILTLALIIFSGLQAHSQSYTFTRSTGAYQDLTTSDYAIPDTSPYFDNIQLMVDFNFTGFSTTYDLLNNGASVVIKGGYFFTINNTRSTTAYMYNIDMDARPGAGQVSEFSYLLSGTSGSRLLKLQWKNMGFEFGDSADFINFQVWLYEASGKIEVHFGPSAVKVSAYNGAPGPVIGLLEMNPAFSTIFQQMYLVNSEASPTVKTNGIDALTGTPAPNSIYTFTMTGTSVAGIFPEAKYNASFSSASKLDIQIEGTEKDARAELYSLQGKMLGNTALRNGNNEMLLNQLSTGVYILRIYNGDQVVSRKLLNNN